MPSSSKEEITEKHTEHINILHNGQLFLAGISVTLETFCLFMDWEYIRWVFKNFANEWRVDLPKHGSTYRRRVAKFHKKISDNQHNSQHIVYSL